MKTAIAILIGLFVSSVANAGFVTGVIVGTALSNNGDKSSGKTSAYETTNPYTYVCNASGAENDTCEVFPDGFLQYYSHNQFICFKMKQLNKLDCRQFRISKTTYILNSDGNVKLVIFEMTKVN